MKITQSETGSVRVGLIFATTVVSVAFVAGGLGMGYGFSALSDLDAAIAASERLSSEDRHTEAIAYLDSINNSWMVDFLGVKEAEIASYLEEFETREQHLAKYQQAIEKDDQGEWDTAIALLSEIPDESFYRQKADLKAAEGRRSILESQLEAEQQARETAERLATREEQAKLEAQARANEESRKRAEAETKARHEALKRAEEEAARKAAETDAAKQALLREKEETAREAAQREAEAQSQRAKQQERERVLQLAATQPLIRAIVSGELKFYIEPLPPYASPGVPDAIADVASSFSLWSPYGASIQQVYAENNADLIITWVRDYGSHTLGESIFKAYIKVGLGSTNCIGEWQAFDQDTVKKVLWHELGHSMGYGHSSDPNNVMYFQTETRFNIEQEISEVIAGGWYYTFPLCDSGTYRYSFETADPNMGIDIFVLPPNEDPNTISGGGGSVYTGCGKARMHRYSGSCNVAPGASIYVANSSYYTAIRLTGEITSLDQLPWPEMTWDEKAYQYDEDELLTYWDLFHK